MNCYETRAGDDDILTLRSQRGPTIVEPEILTFELRFATDLRPADSIDLRIKWRINEPGGFARVRLRNWDNGEFEEVALINVDMTEREEIIHDISAVKYVHRVSGLLDMQIEAIVVASFSFLGFDGEIDHLQVRIE